MLDKVLLFLILVAALALRTLNPEAQHWGAEYYTAAALSMSQSGHNFFFAAFDPSGFISVDKPPLALWIQALSIKLSGFSPMAVLLPQALAGALSCGLLYLIVRKAFGVSAAVTAALFLAVTPIWVAVNRTNNMDSLLTLFMLLAAWALMQAIHTRNARYWWLSMAIVGLAFNVKMLAAFVLLPAFFLVYGFFGAGSPWQRCKAWLSGGLVLLAFALPWVLVVHFTSVAERPWVGGSPANDISELILGHNARNRFALERRSRGLARPGASPVDTPAEAAAQSTTQSPPQGSASPGSTREWVRKYFSRSLLRTRPGPARLVSDQLPSQFAWWLPLSLLGLFAMTALARNAARGQATAMFTSQKSLAETSTLRKALLGLLALWTLSDWLLYSSMGGIIHFYYLATLAPALAALSGIALARAWRRASTLQSVVLWAAVLATALWQMVVHSMCMEQGLGETLSQVDDPHTRIALAMLAVTLLALILRGKARAVEGPQANPMGTASLVLVSLALCALPLAWSLAPVAGPVSGLIPTADLYITTHLKDQPRALEAIADIESPDLRPLIKYLQSEHRGETWLLSTSTTRLAAPLIIATGQAVQARGGFHGLDRAINPEQLAAQVKSGQLRFAMLNDVAQISRRLGADAAGKEVAAWIRQNGKLVDPAQWRAPGARETWELFDLRAQ